MSQLCTTTCDACGYAEENAAAFRWDRPAGWLTVAGLGPPIIGDAVFEQRKKQPDLCSWKCVAAYAAQRAGEEAAQKQEEMA